MSSEVNSAEAPEWEQRAYGNVKNLMLELMSGYNAGDRNKKLEALDGLIGQSRAWRDLLKGKVEE